MAGNLLIVDDELDILEGLAELYELELDDVTIYTANNARKALILLKKIRFDVVVTDINMPKMNGLELFKEIREGWPQCRVIFLTGYREFDYLYEINKHQDVAYVLKSEADEVLIQVVRDAFISFDLLLSEMETDQSAEGIKDKKYRYLTAQMARMLAETYQADSQLLIEFAQAYHFDSSRSMFFFFLKVDEGNSKKIWGIDAEMYQLLKAFFPVGLNFFYQAIDEKHGILLIQAFEVVDEVKLHQQYVNSIGALSYVQEKLINTHNISLSFITYSSVYLADIINSYQDLLVLSYRYLRNQSQSILRKETIEMDLPEKIDTKKIFYQLTTILESHESEKLESKMDEILDIILLDESELLAKEIYQGVMGIFLATLLKSSVFKDEDELFIPYTSRINAVKALLHRAKKLTALDEKMSESVSMNESISKVREYIHTHLSGDLSLNILAEICYLNPSYLSRIFKKVTGWKVSDYVSFKRIEAAKNLLINTQLKVNEVGQKVGYHTPHSFTRLFKKIVGVSPIEYRDRYGRYE